MGGEEKKMLIGLHTDIEARERRLEFPKGRS